MAHLTHRFPFYPLLFSLLVGLFFLSCKSPNSSNFDPVTIKDLFPLAYGHYWIYNLQFFDLYDTASYSTTLTEESRDSVMLDGHLQYILDYGNLKDFQSYYFSGTDLIYTYTNAGLNPK